MRLGRVVAAAFESGVQLDSLQGQNFYLLVGSGCLEKNTSFFMIGHRLQRLHRIADGIQNTMLSQWRTLAGAMAKWSSSERLRSGLC